MRVEGREGLCQSNSVKGGWKWMQSDVNCQSRGRQVGSRRKEGRKGGRSRWSRIQSRASCGRHALPDADDGVCCLVGAFLRKFVFGGELRAGRPTDRRARHFRRRRRRHSGPLSLFLSLDLSISPFFLHSHTTRLMPPSLHVLAAVRESHENRFVRKVQIRTRNGRRGRRAG